MPCGCFPVLTDGMQSWCLHSAPLRTSLLNAWKLRPGRPEALLRAHVPTMTVAKCVCLPSSSRLLYETQNVHVYRLNPPVCFPEASSSRACPSPLVPTKLSLCLGVVQSLSLGFPHLVMQSLRQALPMGVFEGLGVLQTLSLHGVSA